MQVLRASMTSGELPATLSIDQPSARQLTRQWRMLRAGINSSPAQDVFIYACDFARTLLQCWWRHPTAPVVLLAVRGEPVIARALAEQAMPEAAVLCRPNEQPQSNLVLLPAARQLGRAIEPMRRARSIAGGILVVSTGVTERVVTHFQSPAPMALIFLDRVSSTKVAYARTQDGRGVDAFGLQPLPSTSKHPAQRRRLA